jgi:Protein of unknown function (DUF2971)
MLNDPFDPYFFLEIKFGNNYRNLHGYIKKYYAAKLSWFENKVTPQSWSQTIAVLRRYFMYLRQTTFVFCTVASQAHVHPKDNLYMWGHYGNGHRGIAIEFDANELKQAMIQDKTRELFYSDVPDAWVKMKYEKCFPPLTPEHFIQYLEGDKTPYENYLNMMTTVKSHVWKRENEWRLMWRNDETKMKICKRVIPQAAITNISFGVNISDRVKTDIIYESTKQIPQAPNLSST